MQENFQPKKEILFSLENWIKNEFEKDYDDQVKILDNLGLLEILPNVGEMGILGIDGKEYPIPTKEAIISEIMKDKEKYETKMKQGFVQIQLTPFASPLEKLVIMRAKAARVICWRRLISFPALWVAATGIGTTCRRT